MAKQRGVVTLAEFPGNSAKINERQQIEKEGTERDTRVGMLLEIGPQTTQLIRNSRQVW